MVSFSCESCGDVLTKKKLDPHRNQCRGASFTCLDCMVHFEGFEYRSHTSCISEAQKYQGALYKDKKKNGKPQQRRQEKEADPTNSQALVPRKVFEAPPPPDNRVAIVDAPPRAPSPPPAFNVFDFLVDNTHPRSPSLQEDTPVLDDEDFTSDSSSEDDLDDMDAEPCDPAEETFEAAREYMKQELMKQGYAYGADPIEQSNERFDSYNQLPISPAELSNEFYTPAPPRGHQRNISNLSTDSVNKESNKKRKRGQPEDLDLSSAARAYPPNSDVIMTDVPPVLHSGLTGGLNRLLHRPELPPSPPDMDGVDSSPHSPLKRTRHAKEDPKERGRTREKEKEKDKKARKGDKKARTDDKSKSSRRDPDIIKKNGQWVRRRPRKDSPHSVDKEAPARKQLKAIEYKPSNETTAEVEANANNALVLHSQNDTSHAELFLSFVTKGPESERGCSINKALKRYHRERPVTSKEVDEKELWKVLRLKRNERGEVVLFIEGEEL